MTHEHNEGSEEIVSVRGIQKVMHKQDTLPRVLLLALLGATTASTAYAVKLRFDIGGRVAKTSVAIERPASPAADTTALQEAVLPSKGIALPLRWGDMGKRMTENGTIDLAKFKEIYAARGGLSPKEEALLTQADNGAITITRENSAMLLNLFWAFGLANKNTILEKGPMKDPRYGGADKFASTGGWTIAKGNAMNHYSKHKLVDLTEEQQLLVEKLALSIYRPCCDNPTIFPDCNHGMAMLGMLELMASQGATEQQMWDAALAANAYWFPENYMTLATYFKNNGREWKSITPAEILDKKNSSSSGYRTISAQVSNPVGVPSSGGGCGVSYAPGIKPKGVTLPAAV